MREAIDTPCLFSIRLRLAHLASLALARGLSYLLCQHFQFDPAFLCESSRRYGFILAMAAGFVCKIGLVGA